MTSSERWRRIEEIFTAALDISPDQRDLYLDTACSEDPVLRKEVATLLAREDDESDVIAGIIEDTAANLFDDEPPPPDVMAGAELGNYRIIREIGRGGMGAVYLAVRADRTFDKQVAIKLVKRGIDTDAVLQRFWHERRILAGLDHPYIARLIDGGTSPDGRPYFVMEFVDGQPLDAYVREKSLSIRERCEIFNKVCEAVSYAHRNLVIHRDLKPANVLVTADGTPKLLDFGIARLLSVDPDERTIAGPVGMHALTPEFASPEQVHGDAITTATDVFSLGSTLRAILPADGRLPQDLATITGKAMREEIEQRFASVADLREDVRRYLAGLPILAREQTVAYRTAKFVRRHQLGVAVAGVAVVLLFGGVAGIIWEARKADAQRRRAEQRLGQAVELADRTLKDLNSSIAQVPGTTEARRQMVRNTLEYLDRLAKDTGGDPRVLTALATAYMRVGDVLGNSGSSNLGDLPGSLATYQRALSVIQTMLDADPDSSAIQKLASEAHQGTGNILESLGRTREAEAEYQAAIKLADAALAQAPFDREARMASLDTHYARGLLLYSTQPDQAMKIGREQLPLAAKLAAEEPGDVEIQLKLSDFYALIGTALNRENHLDEALAYYRRAAGVREVLYANNPRNSKVQRNLILGYGHIADMLGNPFIGCIGDYRGALVYYQKIAALVDGMRRADPSDKRADLDMGMIWTRLGATRQAAGDIAGSNADLDRAIGLFESLSAASPSNAVYSRGLSIAYEFRARNRWLQGDRKSALVTYRKSLAIASRLLEARQTDISARLQQLADEGPIATLLALAGDRAGAIKNAQQMLTETQKLPSGARRDLHLAQSWNWYAQTYEALGDNATAADAYEKSAANWKRVIGSMSIPPYRAKLQEAMRKAGECQKRLQRTLTKPA